MRYQYITLEEKTAIEELSKLASAIVKEHYDPILGNEQNDYMIEKFQSVKALTEQLEHGYQYYMVYHKEQEKAGFLAFYKRNQELYLSKLYLKRECRGKGLSKDMLEFVRAQAKHMGVSTISLNVNKYNPSIAAYEKLGFERTGEEKNPIGNGYFMDDYVYSLKV